MDWSEVEVNGMQDDSCENFESESTFEEKMIPCFRFLRT